MRLSINSKLYPQDYHQAEGSLAIKFPMNAVRSKSNKQIFNLSYTTEEQAISNYINLLLTKDGERYMQPTFGVGLWYYVFEQNALDFDLLLETRIKEQAAKWLPYIINKNIRVSSNLDSEHDGHTISILIEFSVTESGANRSITLSASPSGEANIEVR